MERKEKTKQKTNVLRKLRRHETEIEIAWDYKRDKGNCEGQLNGEQIKLKRKLSLYTDLESGLEKKVGCIIYTSLSPQNSGTSAEVGGK